MERNFDVLANTRDKVRELFLAVVAEDLLAGVIAGHEGGGDAAT